jgi:hypothetical protein
MESQEQGQDRGKGGGRLLEQVRNVMRLQHYSIHTERSYQDWIKRCVHFHRMRSREDLAQDSLRRKPAVGWGLVGVEPGKWFVGGVAVHETEVAAR